jgi:hypothetical protein
MVVPMRQPGRPGSAGGETANRGRHEEEEVMADQFCGATGRGTHRTMLAATEVLAAVSVATRRCSDGWGQL